MIARTQGFAIGLVLFLMPLTSWPEAPTPAPVASTQGNPATAPTPKPEKKPAKKQKKADDQKNEAPAANPPAAEAAAVAPKKSPCSDATSFYDVNKDQVVTLVAKLKELKGADDPDEICIQRLEDALGVRLFVDKERVGRLEDLIEETSNGSSYITDLSNQATTIRTEITSLTAAGITTVETPVIFPTFDDYARHYYKFFAGVEYATVQSVFQKGFPKIGISIYRRPLRAGDKDAKDIPNPAPAWFPDYAGTVSLTSSAEQAVAIPGASTAAAARTVLPLAVPSATSNAASSTAATDGKRSLQANLAAFWPLETYSLGKYTTTDGVLVDLGLRKTDDVPQYDRRYYIGIRSAINPDLFFDVMYGKTESLVGRRGEIRLQGPIYPFDNGTQIYLGAIANFGVTDRHRVNPTTNKLDDDTFTVFVIWNVPFSSFVSGSGASKK